MRLKLPDNERVVRMACVFGLLALPMMVWSVFDPRAFPVLIALSVGQGLGTLSFALFLIAVARDLRLKARLSADDPKAESRR